MKVDLGHDAFTLVYDSSEVSESKIKMVIAALGYRPRVARPEELAGSERPKAPSTIPEPVAGVLKEAQRKGYPILVDFYAEWCAPCKILDKTILPDPLVKRALEAFIFLHVDTDEFPKAGEEYAVDAMPTMVVLDSEGRELHRFVGLMEPEELARRLSEIARRAADE